jgi:pyruvate dehydrogenase kinase 2/3/4
MKEMKSVQQVKDLYITSLLELASVSKQITCIEQEEAFATMLEGIYDRHAGVLVGMARGAFELRALIRNSSTSKRKAVEFDAMEETHQFLDRFYISRIG